MKDLKNPLYILLISLVTSDGLTVTMKKPLISAVRGADVTIPCDISDFTLGRIITVTWSKSEGGHKSEVYSFIPGRAVAFRDGARMEEGNIQRGNAALHIPQAQFSDDGEYTCTVIVTPESREGRSILQVSAVPSAVLTPGDAVTVELGSEKVVLCEVTNFYPKDVTIHWVRHEKDSRCVALERGTCIGDAVSNPDGTFNVTSHLTLYPTLQDTGFKYSCLVKHRSLHQELMTNFTLTVTDILMEKYLTTPKTNMANKNPPKRTTGTNKDKNINKTPSAPKMQAGKGSPSPNKSDDSATQGDFDDTQMETLAIKVSKILMPMFDSKFNQLQTSINSVLTQITTLTQKIGELENRVVDCETSTSDIRSILTRQQTTIDYLKDKVDDLENRSRRSNLRFVGIPESIKGEDLITLLTKDLPKALDLSFPQNPPLIERAHRLGDQIPDDKRRPRPAIAKFLYYTAKEAILKAYRQRRSLIIRDFRVLIFQDFSPTVTARRKLFTPICSQLVEKNIRFQLLFPAKLKETHWKQGEERKENSGTVVGALVGTLLATVLLFTGLLYHEAVKKDPPVLSEITGSDLLTDMTRTTLTFYVQNFKPNDLEISVRLRRRGEEMKTIHTWRSRAPAPSARAMRDEDAGGSSVNIDVERQSLLNGAVSQTQGPLHLDMAAVLAPSRPGLLRFIRWQRLSTYSCQCSAHITPSYAEDNGAELSVHVFHPALTEAACISRTLRVTGVAPTLLKIVRPAYVTHEEQTTLTCPIMGFKPRTLQVTWLKVDQGGRETEIVTWNSIDEKNTRRNHEITEHELEDKSYCNLSALMMRPCVQKDDGVTYICRAYHPATEKRAEQAMVMNVTAVPVLDAIKQTEETVHVGGTMKLSCKIHSFYPATIEATWHTDDGRILPSVTTDILPDQSGLFHATSSMSYTPALKDRRRTFRCEVKHQSS
ncbi:uncharacterized protein, partial [Ranitomeya imitator]|uniref:uncharacterized protein n=1 Tax=Ranitomeya imitator TaxID=111125 RepID=UPI0037E79BCE